MSIPQSERRRIHLKLMENYVFRNEDQGHIDALFDVIPFGGDPNDAHMANVIYEAWDETARAIAWGDDADIGGNG